MSFPITAFYASLLALCYIYLSFAVINVRRSARIGVGDGGNDELTRAIRVHGNFSEYVPITLILLACLESLHPQHWVLHAGGCAILFGRILHAYGLRHSEGTSWQRLSGMLLTFLSMLFLACSNLFMIHYLI
ncbi:MULTISPECIES: MAPEG family protein [unclassified Alteromonas]|uniref:MAPEG family protein n=1 Tax=unclassified Alteromonas TaxID=2614992 RepID=UPI000E69AB61|nr:MULTISPECIES: MAPEG family protein [unclassified Alteromonas]AYA65029.1 glutathione S-transferase [Alteromonas sp. RKMC-009]MDO6477689.1 MAPEG family protein [Alteromonas sp. 1_MG-2023]MEC7692243.1 MAPEG family protein [Pseudomonadota bacterium]